MPYLHCPYCFGDPTETGKASWQLVEVEEVGDIFLDGYYKCPSCGSKFDTVEFHDLWDNLEDERRTFEEQQAAEDDYEGDDDEEFDEFGRPY